ncbi:MAG: SWIM zinc finger family protein [Chloroflexales bacterium]|nr:SWIM zinc finger family protein [Chloroflexales bacterium]
MTITSDELRTRNVVQLKKIQGASRQLHVVPQDPERGLYLVESASLPGHLYHVALAPDGLWGECSCPWGQYGGTNCKHVLAALQERYASEGRLSFWKTPQAAQRQHRRTLRGENLIATVRKR